MTAAYRPVVLCVLDGWGIAPDSPSNAATRAVTPRLDAILRDDPHAKLEASGVAALEGESGAMPQPSSTQSTTGR